MDRTELIRDESGNYVERTLHYKPMWYHERGLQQTATGYGSRLNTGYMVEYAGRLRRVYMVCYSNVGSCYVLVKGERKFLGL